MGELILCDLDFCQESWSSNFDSLQDGSLIILRNLGVSTLTLVGKMKRVSESAGLITTNGAPDGNTRLLHRISFLVFSYYSAFLCVNLTQKPLTISAEARGLLYLWTLLLWDKFTARAVVQRHVMKLVEYTRLWVYLVADWLMDFLSINCINYTRNVYVELGKWWGILKEMARKTCM